MDILLEWFDNKNNKKRQDTPIKAHPTYEDNLAQCPPFSQNDVQHCQIKYEGAYNQTIGKLLHIQEWTCPDINYTISRPAVYANSHQQILPF